MLPILALVAGCASPLPSVPTAGGSATRAFGLLADGGDPLIIGHRGGASGRAPENTMAAFRLGPTLGAAVLECDVHCSRDGALVVIHDTTVDRTTNGKGPVHQLTLAELKGLDAGAGERIPTLEELLAWTAGQPGLGLTIEIKARTKICPQAPDMVLAAVNKAGLASRSTIISFHRQAVARVEQVQPALGTGLLFFSRVKPIKTAKAIGADMIWPVRQRTTAQFVRSAHDANLGVYSWTLNTAKHLLDARRVGVDAVITDFPAVARDAFENGSAPPQEPGAGPEPLTDPEDREDPDDLATEL